MTVGVRQLAMALVVGVVLLAGWRIYGQYRSEQAATVDPQQALRWRSGSSVALLVLAEQQLTAGALQAAEISAKRVLENSPLRGQAFRILAAVAAKRGDQVRALRLYQVAVRRSPRDLPSRVWLAQYYLEQGKYPSALAQIDSLLRMSPQRAVSINPVMVQMAQEPAFADALAKVLATNPPWRDGTLAALRDPKIGNSGATGRVMQELQANGGLSQDEYRRWLDSLMAQGKWGEAYARWASLVVKAEGRLPLLYNGNFTQDPSDTGFDWRLKRVPGVLLEFVPDTDGAGQVVHVNFLDRRIPEVGLTQALLLSPGRYQLSLRQRASTLRSELGLQWQITCAGAAGVVARSDAVQGSFAWNTLDIPVEIPQQDCQGQWLRLVNPVPAGAAQGVSGELWLTDFTLTPQS